MANIIESTVVNVRVGVKSALESLESKGSKSKPKAKYEVLTGKKHTAVVDGVTYCRIRALRGFDRPFGLPPVEPGDLGGFVAVTRMWFAVRTCAALLELFCMSLSIYQRC